jgi:hypothetical protein
MSDLMPEGQPTPLEPAPDVEPVQEEQFSISPQDWEAIQQQQGYLMEQVGQIARALQPQDQGFQPPADSLLSPEEWEYNRQMTQQMIQQAVAPLYQMRDQYTQDVGSEYARDILSDEVARNGDFIYKGSFDRALAIADQQYLPQAVQKYGENIRAAEAAVQQAAADVREWEQEVGRAYHQQQMNQLRGISSAPRQPPAGGTGAIQPHTLPEGRDELAVSNHYFGVNR